ncbi:uncharacterized protein LOC143759239 [Ranitomeya variabilis]|uniref:uncharacterized protein LOC143759239 n=1 Tax=Ranitomeya variabilis TaxID=490064 RepID=UPI004056F4E2
MSNRVEFIREFLEIYQSFPCLWKIKSPEYSNREKRKAGYSKLIELYNLHAPEEQATETVVKKKIQALRTVWRKELNKVLKSSKSGSSTEEVYVPKLWYFDYLNFLRDQEVPRSSTCLRLLAPVEPTVPQNHVELDSQGQPEESAQDSGQDSAQDNAQDCSTSETMVAAPARSQWRQGSRKRKATSDVSHELLSMAKKVLTRKTSPALEGFGLYIADKLSTMEARQRTLTERLIFEAVSKGLDGSLDENTHGWFLPVQSSGQSPHIAHPIGHKLQYGPISPCPTLARHTKTHTRQCRLTFLRPSGTFKFGTKIRCITICDFIFFVFLRIFKL